MKTIANMSELQSGIDFIKDNIVGIDRKQKMKMRLLAEEMMVKMLESYGSGPVSGKDIRHRYDVGAAGKDDVFRFRAFNRRAGCPGVGSCLPFGAYYPAWHTR